VTEGTFAVRVENVGFDAAHFASIGADVETLHGHSYRVACEVRGSLTDDGWVVDFGVLKRLLRTICQDLDHKVILQTSGTVIRPLQTPGGWLVRTPREKEYLFPTTDVAPLPAENSTAECLAQWLNYCLRQVLGESVHLDEITVEVWEGPGQRASNRWRPDQS
jgi:6-pyruvoyltetrahydropterin/6-carboxytetrahydropterin synthase